jgi:hypothetical protein
MLTMLKLHNVELINLSIVNAELGVKALRHSSKNIEFGRKVIYTHYRPENLTDDIEFVKIKELTPSTIDSFAIKILPTYQKCDYMISLHTDGFIINPLMWKEEFLEYDYIGAPWPDFHWNKINRVGNGGFVMKSKKFTQLESQINYITGGNDWLVTNYYYDSFIESGCKYSPIELAACFSLELPIPEVPYDLTKSFGFHGRYTEEAKKLVSALENYDEY